MQTDGTPLALNSLPGLIAGPIVRRLTRNRVSIWFATRFPDLVTCSVWSIQNPPRVEQATMTPVRCGSNLWVGVVTIEGFEGSGNDSFVAGTTYEYELSSVPWETAPPTSWQDLSYDGASNPSFIGAPAKLADLKLAHASCRMPHGQQRDAMSLLDIPDDRAGLLLLSGDQIYADSVAVALLPRIRRVAEDLVAVSEDDVFPASVTGLDARQEVTSVSESGEGFGFTSGEAKNHLWRYEEYVAMYLLVWSDVLWPEGFPQFDSVDLQADLDPESKRSEGSWERVVERLEQFRASLPGVRRLLANTPTLMIFDDHEVTDDWNLNHEWCRRVYANPAGSRIIVNGLLAYTIFQHWGNVPEAFEATGSPESAVLAAARTSSGRPDWDALKPLLGVPDAVPGQVGDLRILDSSSVRFDVGLGADDSTGDDGGWPARIVLLDERTARRIDPDRATAGRISTTALDQMLPEPGSGPDARLLVVVAPAPVIGLNLLENQLQPAAVLMAGLKDEDGVAKYDYEPWAAFPESFEHLLGRLNQYRRVVVISGDVHFGFTRRLEYRAGPSAEIGRIAQFVSSGSKHFTKETVALQVYGELMRRLRMIRTRKYQGFDSLSAQERLSLSLPPPGDVSLQYDDAADVALGRVARAAQESPAVFAWDVAEAYDLPTSGWEYTITDATDDSMPGLGSPDLIRIETAAETPSPLGWNPKKSLSIVRGLQAADLWRIGHVLVGLPQAARIDFTAGPSLRARHRILVASGASGDTGSVEIVTTSVLRE